MIPHLWPRQWFSVLNLASGGWPRPRPRSIDQDGNDAVGYGVYKCFFSSTFDFDSFDEIFLLLYYKLLKFELIVLTNFSYEKTR